MLADTVHLFSSMDEDELAIALEAELALLTTSRTL